MHCISILIDSSLNDLQTCFCALSTFLLCGLVRVMGSNNSISRQSSAGRECGKQDTLDTVVRVRTYLISSHTKCMSSCVIKMKASPRVCGLCALDSSNPSINHHMQWPVDSTVVGENV